MNLTFARKYYRLLSKTEGILYQNPLLALGLALPLAVIPSFSITGTVAISLAMLLCFVPTVFLASLLRGRFSTAGQVIVYPLVSCLLLIPAGKLVSWISPLIFDTLGVYFSLICVNSLLMFSVGQAQKKTPFAALKLALRQWLGATLVALVLGLIRELTGSGSVWGVTLLRNIPRLPVAQMAMGGFILMGFFAALCRLIHRSILRFTIKSGAALDAAALAQNQENSQGGKDR